MPRRKPAARNASRCMLPLAGWPSIVSTTMSRVVCSERCATSAAAARVTTSSVVDGRMRILSPRRSAIMTTMPSSVTSNAPRLRGLTNGSRAASCGIGNE